MPGIYGWAAYGLIESRNFACFFIPDYSSVIPKTIFFPLAVLVSVRHNKILFHAHGKCQIRLDADMESRPSLCVRKRDKKRAI